MKIRYVSHNSKFSSSRGFTLIELLVVISIIGMLSSVVFASLQTARQKGVVSAGIKFATYNYRYLGADAFGIWDFNEAGAGARDTSGNNFNATYSGGPVKDSSDRPSNSGSSMSFPDGIASNVTATTNGKNVCNSTGACDQYTISAWIKPTMPTGAHNFGYILEMVVTPIVRVGNPSMYYNYGSGANQYKIGCGQVGIQAFVFNQTLPIGAWHQVTCSYKTGQISLYVNGKLISQNAVANNPAFLDDVVQTVRIGNDATTPATVGSSFVGKLDDVSFYGRSLTSNEIETIYAMTAPAHGIVIK